MEEELKKKLKEAKAALESSAGELKKHAAAIAESVKESALATLPEKTRSHLVKAGEEFSAGTKVLAAAALHSVESKLKELRTGLEKRE